MYKKRENAESGWHIWGNSYYENDVNRLYAWTSNVVAQYAHRSGAKGATAPALSICLCVCVCVCVCVLYVVKNPPFSVKNRLHGFMGCASASTCKK